MGSLKGRKESARRVVSLMLTRLRPRYLWHRLPANSTGCCNFDASDLDANPPVIRRVTCIDGVLDTVSWSGDELRGDLSSSGFADSTTLNQATGTSLAQWSKIDFSRNKEWVVVLSST
jgi:hypothetical protein